MRILGIDPGTVLMGYGVIDSDNDGDMRVITSGALKQSARLPIGQRLNFFFDGLLDIIDSTRPEVAAIESPFMGKNARAALAVGRAQAIALLAAAKRGIPGYEYTPAQVKQTVTDYGGSDKSQVQAMVKLQLNLDYYPEPSDAADALAIAICHLRQTHLKKLLRKRGTG
jgi:crossover junction endodeoxyribonuclease RuvC